MGASTSHNPMGLMACYSDSFYVHPYNLYVKWNRGWKALRIDWLRTCIRKVLGSNLGRYTGYQDVRLRLYSSLPPCKCRDSTPIRLLLLPSKLFSIYLLNSSYHSTLHTLDTESAVKESAKQTVHVATFRLNFVISIFDLITSSTKTRKSAHINMCQETFNLWVTAERVISAQNALHEIQCTPRHVSSWTASSVLRCRGSCG
jgi:hypothetical protein